MERSLQWNHTLKRHGMSRYNSSSTHTDTDNKDSVSYIHTHTNTTITQLECGHCNEGTGKFTTITPGDEVDVPGGRGIANLVQKCKL